MRTRCSVFQLGLLCACAGLSVRVDGATPRGKIGGVVVDQAGAAVSHAWVGTDNGRLAQTDASGAFELDGLSDGGYAVKVVAPQKNDVIVPRIALQNGEAPNLRIVITNAAGPSSLVAGSLKDAATGKKIAAYLEISNENRPVRGFDVDGRPYGGRADVPPQMWHQKNKRYWTAGDFAFSARPGDLRIRARADGYEPVTITDP
jgi:hypothetical protein